MPSGGLNLRLKAIRYSPECTFAPLATGNLATQLGEAVLVVEDGSVYAGQPSHGEYAPLMAEEPPPLGQGAAAEVLEGEEGDAGTATGGHGVVGCSFHLAKAILGVGVTAMPHAFLLLGAVPAALAFLGMAWLTYYSCDCLVRGQAATGRVSYSGVMTQQLGRWASVALDLSMLLNCFGMQVVYLIVTGDVLAVAQGGAQLAGPLSGPGAWGLLQRLLEDRKLLLGLITLFVLAPMLSFRRLKHTTFVSGLGVAAIAVWAAATVALGIALAARQGGHGISLWLKWHWFSGPPYKAMLRLAAVFPVILCAYMCQMSFFAVTAELHPRTVHGMRRAAGAAIVACFVLFAVLSLASQVLFGDKVQHNVLKNFTVQGVLAAAGGSRRAAHAVVLAVRSAYLLSILASFPLQMAPFRDSLSWLAGGDGALLRGAGGFYLTTYITLGAVYLAAVSLESIWVPLQLVGATAGAIIAFILPGLLALSLHRGRRRSAGGLLLVSMGLVAGLAGVVSVLWPD